MKAPEFGCAGPSEVGSLDSEPPSDPARHFRDALERHIISLEMSRDGYKVRPPALKAEARQALAAAAGCGGCSPRRPLLASPAAADGLWLEP